MAPKLRRGARRVPPELPAPGTAAPLDPSEFDGLVAPLAVSLTLSVPNVPTPILKGADTAPDWLTVLAPSGNAATIYVGGPAVDSRNGYPLAKGTSVNLKRVSVGAICAYGTAGDSVSVIG
jgi:hypothetical protein